MLKFMCFFLSAGYGWTVLPGSLCSASFPCKIAFLLPFLAEEFLQFILTKARPKLEKIRSIEDFKKCYGILRG